MSAEALADGLVTIVRRRPQAERDQLLTVLGELSATERSFGRPAVHRALEPLFIDLVRGAERDLRRRLAARLAPSAWAPPGVMRYLADDEIEIARPVIAESPLLTDDDLLRLLREAGAEHRIEIASRDRLGEVVSAAIVAGGEPSVMTALAANPGATISDVDMALLVEASRPIVGLRAPLSRHPRLTDALARRLYVWVGDQLRESLADRFELDTVALEAEIDRVVDDAVAAQTASPSLPGESERRLVAKLADAGQLRPGYLLRALRDERLALFEAALAEIGDFEPASVRRALESDSPDMLALVCVAVGLDRSVFSTVLAMVRRLNGARPGGGESGATLAEAIFGAHEPAAAATAFRRLAAEV